MQIDIKKFDAETVDLQKTIDDLILEIEMRKKFRTFIVSNGKPLDEHMKLNANRTLKKQPDFNFNATDIASVRTKRLRGLTQFLLDSAKTGRKTTKVIALEYAMAIGQPLNMVYKNVTKNLSRLKEQGRLTYIGERGTGIWSVPQ